MIWRGLSMVKIWIYTWDSPKPYWLAFADMARHMKAGLAEIGIASEIVLSPEQPEGDDIIVLGANMLAMHEKLVKNCFIWQAEHMTSRWATPEYVRLLGQNSVLEALRHNMPFYDRYQMQAVYMPVAAVGFKPFAPAEKTIDVLTYGSISFRREAVLDKLRDKGFNCVNLFNVWDEERDEYIKRSRLVLTMRYGEGYGFEAVRVSHLLQRRAPVIAEKGGVMWRTPCAAYDDLPDVIADLLGNPDKLDDLMQGAYLAYHSDRMADNLRRVFDVSENRKAG